MKKHLLTEVETRSPLGKSDHIMLKIGLEFGLKMSYKWTWMKHLATAKCKTMHLGKDNPKAYHLKHTN